MSDIDTFELSDIEQSTFNSSITLDLQDALPLKRFPEIYCDEYDLVPGTDAFKKAKKRRQNRQSAARARARKRMDQSHLEISIKEVHELNRKLKIENEFLRNENNGLKRELGQCKDIIKAYNPKMAKIKTGSTIITGSVALTLVCLILVTQTVSTELRPSQEHVRFLESGGPGESVSCGVLGIVILGIFSVFRAFQYFGIKQVNEGY